MASPIPDGWLEYTPIGKKIEGTRFIAFKVPLEKHVARSAPQDIRLDGEILLEKIPNLGLIIDLTNTHRFYNPSFFANKGIAYEKIMIPGHATPSEHLANKFTEVVKKFIATNKDNDKLIGVHCTHGVNRTGYLICNYMIGQMNVKPQEAMNRFAKCRGHKINRTNYIQSLHTPMREKEGNYGIKPQSKEKPDNTRNISHTRNDSSSTLLSQRPPSSTEGRISRSRFSSPYCQSSESRNANNTSTRNSHCHKNNTCPYNRPGEKSFGKQSNNPTSRLRLDYYNNVLCKKKKNDF